MIVSTVARPVRNPGAVEAAGQARPLVDIAALCRRALIRNELLLNIAAVSRPTVEAAARTRPDRGSYRIDSPGDGSTDARWAGGCERRRVGPAMRPRVATSWT